MAPHRAAPIVIDLGKTKKKKIKQLKRGEGELVDEVNAALERVRTDLAGAEGKELVPVVVLWKPKRKRAGILPGF